MFRYQFRIKSKKAQEVFFKTFGYQSQTFIPPNYQFATKCVPVLIENNICLLQASNHFLNEEGKGNVAPLFRKKQVFIMPLEMQELMFIQAIILRQFNVLKL